MVKRFDYWKLCSKGLIITRSKCLRAEAGFCERYSLHTLVILSLELQYEISEEDWSDIKLYVIEESLTLKLDR